MPECGDLRDARREAGRPGAAPPTTSSNKRTRKQGDGETGTNKELRQALAACRGWFFAVAVFSLFINLLMLATPLYML